LRAQLEWRDGDRREGWFAREIRDDQLAMIFACCDPALARDSQVALTLKIVCGFSVAEIARAFLTAEKTIAQRLVRAKRTLRAAAGTPRIPEPGELPPRLESVLETLYLLFNEGYDPYRGERLVREELCAEAIRLVELLAEHEATATPELHALAALLYFQGARLRARSDARGEVTLLADQDRNRWHGPWLRRGLEHLSASARGSEISQYHLQAEIASCHSLAPSWNATDWRRIAACYEQLLLRRASPVIQLNRAVVTHQIEGPAAALLEIDRLELEQRLGSYCPFHATRAHLLAELGRGDDAVTAFSTAIALTESEPIRRFFARRIKEIRRGAAQEK
jgi:RNA polymerase sigma-70 factor (ECF subfamily)